MRVGRFSLSTAPFSYRRVYYDEFRIILQQEGSVDRAINALLAMSDPSAAQQEQPVGGTDPFGDAGANFQTADDEEAARQLAASMQDEEFARQLQAEEDQRSREVAFQQQQTILQQQQYQAQQQQAVAGNETKSSSGVGNVFNKIGSGIGGLFKKKDGTAKESGGGTYR